MVTYEQWCKENDDIKRLAHSLHSSKPEQYVAFYLHTVFTNDIEYQKQFKWLGKKTLDIFIPSLNLAIEYDGIYYHSYKKADRDKTILCKKNGITVIRICEIESDHPLTKKKNEIFYLPDKNYLNIGIAINEFCLWIRKHYNKVLYIDVDIKRDSQQILSYVQNKYYEKSIACVWPESKEYWLENENGQTIFDVFYTDNRCYKLKCPHCGKIFDFHMRYYHTRKSLIPCGCEYEKIRLDLIEVISAYKESGKLINFDGTLRSRRLYDQIMSNIRYFITDASKEELELYQKSGIESSFLDLYLSRHQFSLH